MTGFNSKREAAADKMQEPQRITGQQQRDGMRGQRPTSSGEQTARPAQEPVAWLQIGFPPFYDGEVIARTTKPEKWNPEWWKFEPLYTAPSQRKWVGLTDAEIHALPEYSEDRIIYQLIRAAEATLRSKNT